MEALIDRALELDEGYGNGAIHSFLITYKMSRQGAPGDPETRARLHFGRAMALFEENNAGPLVTLAEAVSGPEAGREGIRIAAEPGASY